MHGSEGPYGCGAHLMAVLPDGGCAKCSFYADRPIGSIDEGLRACWQRLRPVHLDELQCMHCPVLEDCRGGCRYRAEVCTEAGGVDPYRCYAFGVKKGPQ